MAALQKRAGEMLKNGDISSARLLLRRLAEAGNPEAALSLGGTFDDEVLAELGAIGFAHDLYQARAWYQRAAQLGSAEAARRLQKFEGAEK
jgi:TPR repeat protein